MSNLFTTIFYRKLETLTILFQSPVAQNISNMMNESEHIVCKLFKQVKTK